MNRGEVWWAELGADAGFRPVVIVPRNESLQRRSNVTIAEVTRLVRSLPSEVLLTRDEGMPVDCVINTDNLHTIPAERLRRRIMELSGERLFALGHSLRYSLELE